MSAQNAPARIIAVDFTPNTILVTFATGELAIFGAAFLFDTREQSGNRVVAKGDEEEVL